MDLHTLKVAGQIAGIGGFSLAVLLIVFRDVLRKQIFPKLTKDQSYRLLRLVLILVFVVAIVGITAWMWTTTRATASTSSQTSPTPESAQNSAEKRNPIEVSSVNANQPQLFNDDELANNDPVLGSPTRVPISRELRQLLGIERRNVPEDMDPEERDEYRVVKNIDLDELNRRNAGGLTLDQFAVNSKVSCFIETRTDTKDHTEYNLRLVKTPDDPGETSDETKSRCRHSHRVLDPIFDITVGNHSDESTVLSGVEALVTDSDWIGGDIQPRESDRIVPVAARYSMTIPDGSNVWLFQLLPPLRVPSKGSTRFQLRLRPAKCRSCEDPHPLHYAFLRFRMVFSESRNLTTDQMQLVY